MSKEKRRPAPISREDVRRLKAKAVRIVVSAFLMLCLMFFLPAGTLRYWQAWVYLTVLFISLIFVMLYLFKNDPGLLIRRLRLKEKEKEQQLIMKAGKWLFFIAFLIPSFDRRFGWSTVPTVGVILADAVALLGYWICFLAFKENSYASRVVEVERAQKLVQTGPYSVVRHPMYVGVILMYLFSPLALGSYWATLAMVPVVGLIIARIYNEEEVLARELKGYVSYTRKVRYRLIPKIW